VVVGWSVRAAARQNRPQVPSPAAVKTTRPAPVTPPSTADSGQTLDDFRCDAWESEEQTKTRIAWKFRYHDAADAMTFTGDKMRVDDRTGKKTADAEGSIVIDDEKHHVTSEKAHVAYANSKKLAILSGNVVIVIKPDKETASAPPAPPAGAQAVPGGGGAPGSDDDKPAVQKDRGQGGTLTCDQVDYYYAKTRKFAIVRGHPVFKQHIVRKGEKALDRTLTADHAEYDGLNDKLVLYPPVHLTDSDGQRLNFTGIVNVGTKEGAETLQTAMPMDGIALHPDDEDSAGSHGSAQPAKTAPGKSPAEKGPTAPPSNPPSNPPAGPPPAPQLKPGP
jgi:lipopolysaccharide export system protein LptA